MKQFNSSGWQRIEPQKTKVVIWGAGDQFRVNWQILVSLGIEVVAFIDQTPEIVAPISEIPLFQSLDGFLHDFNYISIEDIGSIICIGNPHSDKRVNFSRLLKNYGINPVSFADKSSLIRSNVLYGSGLQVMPNALIHNDVKIGENCIINTGSLVEHDCVLGTGVEIGPRAVLTGRVIVEDHAWIGAGAVILPRLKIGSGAIVGAGAIVTKDVPSGSVVVGSPARAIK